MPANSVLTVERRTGTPAQINLLELSCGQIAVALHIAGLPARWRQMPTRSLIDLALRGIDAVGLDEVARINSESQGVMRVLHNASETPAAAAQARTQLECIWRSNRNRQNATDAAWTIFHPLGQTSALSRR